MSKQGILFLQTRPTKGGAQVALSKLLSHPNVLELNPVVVTSTEGWLTRQCRRMEVPCIVQSFPKPRSLVGRAFGNLAFAECLGRTVRDILKMDVHLVVGNDCQEGILVHESAKILKARRAVFLRSSGMRQRDFFKHQCHRFDWVYAIGETLYNLASSWESDAYVQAVHDGLVEEDFFPVKPKSADFPTRILVIGSELPGKGWQDVVRAVDELEHEPEFPALSFDFAGSRPNPRLNNMRLRKKRRTTFHFIGKKENFQQLIRGYDLILNPSRQESFGMAMAEVYAAGIPMLSSRAGVARRIQSNPQLLFEPHDPIDMAQKIRYAWWNWQTIDFHQKESQESLRRQFMLEPLVKKLVKNFRPEDSPEE